MLSAVNIGFYDKLKLWPGLRVNSTAYVLGDIIRLPGSTTGVKSYKCTTAGTTESPIPIFATDIGSTTTDGTVVWTCYDNKTYQIKAPQGSTVPYVTFGLETDVPIGTFHDQFQIENLTYWVNCFSDKSPADVAEIADEVMTAMDDVTLTVTSYTSMKCVREFIGAVIWDLETGIYQVPLRYRVWLDKT